ncbi:hypothetical protein BRADI_5g15470v3 [Brachypodium distachyon]|uniref:Uncharacterized protein n=2 Tax=Brachypodium distachyon TaxID=15368 RepID=I1IZK8_BRADI|nr:hypothetical protein BRADI_5g15470v3 [Brachypodium distachyon]
MGCFFACFGGGDEDRRRRKSRRRSPSSHPPRPDHHVARVGKASLEEDEVVKEASPPLPDVRASAPPPPLVVEASDELVTGPNPGTEQRELREQKTLTPPSLTVHVAEEVVSGASPGGLSQLNDHKELPARSLPQEAIVTPPLFTMKCSPVATTVVSTPDMELREVSEEENRSSGKKKVSFNMNVTSYENTSLPDQEEERSESIKWMKDEDEKHMQKTVLLPENHRYGNCTDSDDDIGDEYCEDDNCGDYSDTEEDFVECKVDLVDEEEMSTDENKEESHESLFSLPMSKDRQNDQEVTSPIPKSSEGPAQEESPLIQGNSHRDRSKYVHPVLNPVQNLSQWKEVKAQVGPVNKLYKENVNSGPDAGASPSSKVANQTKMSPSNASKGDVSVDASLSTWLVSSGNSTVDKAQSKSPRSVSSICREERPVLGALTVDGLKKSSTTSSPRRSPSHNRQEVPILGTVGSYWSCTEPDNECCSSRSDSGTNGIPNTTSKYREDRRVNWHSTPFNVRLDKALKKSSA